MTARLISSVVFVALLLDGLALAQSTQYEKILFPVLTHPQEPVAGAFGSRWVTNLSIVNTSTQPLRLFGVYACFACRESLPVTPGATYTLMPPISSLGSFLLVEKGRADDLTCELRVRDLSREAVSWGSEIPVVRERDFRSTPVHLLDVPVDPRYRISLRVYGYEQAGGGSFTVRVYSQREVGIIGGTHPEEVLLGERTYTLAEQPGASSYPDQYPSFAVITQLPLATALATPSVRIEIVPLSEDLRIWSFAGLTNNETQTVTVLSPD